MFSKIKKKEPKRSLNTIGENFYHFNYKQEELIYKYSCYKRLKKKELKSIKNNQRFDSYLQWKQYIYNKYKDYPKSKLVNFSRYLNQRIKNSKPNKEFTRILITVYLTWFITEILNILVSGEEDLSGLPVWGTITYWIVVLISIFCIVYTTTDPIYDDNIEENLLTDYKEIIDEMLNNK